MKIQAFFFKHFSRFSIFSLKNEPEESVVGPLVLDSPFHE
jgi:hypothetical protein